MTLRFADEGEAITYVFRSMRRLDPRPSGPDDQVRTTAPTRHLTGMANLLTTPREYGVITGSKGKGSTTVMTAKILQRLGHTVGMITSPHMVSYRERIRVNGRAIPEADLLRILSDLAPYIDRIEAELTGREYFSPQGIFLAVGLRWFEEQGVNAVVAEVGRGGRFDDIAVVPNRLSLFTPILLEHVRQLGPTLERIAWHKAGIIKPYSYAYSVPQATEVLRVLETEAEAQAAEFAWIAPGDMGEYLGTTIVNGEPGIRFALGRYGEIDLSLMGRYQVENATLAVQGAGNMHGRLAGISHGSPEYVEAVRSALREVRWGGRVHKLSDKPLIVIDGATTVVAARSFYASVEPYLRPPVAAIVATPVDRDYDGVYQFFAGVAQALILTQNDISPNVVFPPPEEALAAARRYHDHVQYAPTLTAALDAARAITGDDGSILIGAALPVVGEAMQLWGLDFEVI